MFDADSHRKLTLAAELINEVIEEHRMGVTLPVISFLASAVHNIQMGDKYAEVKGK